MLKVLKITIPRYKKRTKTCRNIFYKAQLKEVSFDSMSLLLTLFIYLSKICNILLMT